MATTKKEKTTTERSGTIVSTGNSEREKAIELALQQIERRFGKGAVMKLCEAAKVHVEVISTGSIALDLALCVVQLPLLSRPWRTLPSFISCSNPAVVFTNQLREKIGVMFGNPETTSGGRALKFYASVRLDIRRIDSIKQGQDVMGNRTRVKVVKNKVAPPFRVAEFDIMYSEGISLEGDLIDLGLEMGLVKKSGAWFTVGDIRLGQGRENAQEFLRQNSDVASAIEEQIRGNIISFRAGEVEGKEEEEDNLDEEV